MMVMALAIYERDPALGERCIRLIATPQCAQQVLEAVKQAALTIVVVTGSGQQSLLDRLNTNYPGFFTPELIVSSKDVKHGKPHPEPYLMALQRTGLHPWEAMVVENAPLGVRSASAAEIFTIAVNTGPLPESALLQEGADMLFPSMTALAESGLFAQLARHDA